MKRKFVQSSIWLLFTLSFVLLGLELFARLGLLSSELTRTKKQIAQAHFPKKVLLIGDSFANEYEDSYAGKLRQALTVQAVSVLNQAVPGDGPQQYQERVERFISSYKPDIIIVNYYVGNDLTDTLYKIKQPKKWYRKLEPVFELSYLFWFLREQLNGLIIENRIDWLIKNPVLPSLPPQLKHIRNPGLFAVAQKFPNHLLENLLIESPEAKEAWQINQGYLDKILEINNIHNAKLVLVIVPNSLQVNSSLVEFYRSLGFTADERLLQIVEPQNLLKDYCTKRNLTCLDLLPIFKQDPTRDFYLENDDHWNTDGNQLAFENVLNFLLPYIDK